MIIFQSLFLRLTDPSDPFFYFSLLLTEEDFHELKREQGLLVDLAAFNQARLLAEAGDTAAAVEIWERLAASSAAGPAFQGAAALLSVMHQIDSGDPAALEARLQSLAAEDSGFRPIALEMTAVLALRQGDRARAREVYAQLADDRTAPASLRARASQMLAALEQ